MLENDLSAIVIHKAIEVHKELGPGLLESAYQACLYYELMEMGLKVEKEKEIPLYYKGMQMGVGYRADLIVEDLLIIELKTVEELAPIHTAQMISYLKLSELKLGLILNFKKKLLKQGIRCIVL